MWARLAERSSFSLVRNVPQASRARSAIGDGGNSCLDPTWANSGNLCPNSQYNMHLVAFNFVCTESDGISLWKWWSFPDAFDVHVADLSETFASCTKLNETRILPSFHLYSGLNFKYSNIWKMNSDCIKVYNIWAHPEIASAGWSKLSCMRNDSCLPILIPSIVHR